MKTLVCGDIHCKPELLIRALHATSWDKFVFLGDACDNWGATQEDNLRIIKLLIEIKEKYGEKFVWLMGNHDWGYYDDSIRSSGHILPGAANVMHLLEDAIDMWELFYTDGENLFSHAGMSKSFLQSTLKISMHDLKHSRGINNPLNQVGYASGGTSLTPSFLWARPEEVDTPPKEVVKRQIVGHTPVKTIKEVNGLIVCDTMSQYRDGSFIGDKSLLVIEDNKCYAINGDTGRIINELD